MSMFPRIVLCCAFCLLTVSIASAQKGTKAKPFHTEGVFSNITTGPGGDYGGMQIYLTDSDGQFYVTVTIAEGVLLAPVLVKAQVQTGTRKIEFTLPNENGGSKFNGTGSAAGLTPLLGKTKNFLKRQWFDLA